MKKFKLIIYFGMCLLLSSKAYCQKEYFEGTLEYSLDYEIKNPKISKKKVKKYLGTKIITKFSKGSFKDEYYNNDGELVRTSILNLEESRYYIEYKDQDTIYYSDVDITEYTTEIGLIKDTNLLNNDCWVLESISTHNTDPDRFQTVHTKYYKSKILKVDPDWYTNYVDGGYNRMMKLTPGISIRTKTFLEDFTKIESLVLLKKENINPYEFEIDSKKIKKKM